MKWINLLALFVVLSVLAISAQATNKKTQDHVLKHKPEKVHKQHMLGQWGSASTGQKVKGEHHDVKEVQKHAPLSVSHHEAKAQVDMHQIHSKKKIEKKGDISLQDLLVEDAMHQKLQPHKSHSNHGGIPQTNHAHNSHYLKNNHKMATGQKSTSIHKREKKAPKKVLPSKIKKNKRTKRLHKQYIF